MTENTQTTAQRIQDMLDMNFNFYPGPPGVTAKTIAAEIDRLTAEAASKQDTIDMLLEDERDAFRHERAQLEKQLSEARADEAEAMRLTNSWKAEVERLRLPAEAWEAQRAQRIAFDKFDGKPTTENRDELTAANKAMLSTDAAARAAKERKQ